MSRSPRRMSLAALLVLLLVPGSLPAAPSGESAAGESAAEAPSDAETDKPPARPTAEFQRALEKGREDYNQGNYAAAAEHYVRAIQMNPTEASVYRNMARTLFWKKDYPRAVAYYDFYLQTAPEGVDTQAVARERKLASQRAGDAVWKMPESQKRVLEAFRDELTDGRAYTEGGGGAWALYETLLRTGYAQPDLAHMKKRLRKRLLEEFEGRLVVASDEPTPQLPLDGWQRQQLRLEAAKSLTADSAFRRRVNRRMSLVDAALALLNGQYDTAADLAADAAERNPDMLFVRWYRLSALMEAEEYKKASAALEEFRSALPDADNPHRAYLTAYEAILAHRRGDNQKAASRYYEVLQ